MSYATYVDLVERFGALELDQLTNHAGDCPRIQSAITDASSEIDAYIATRYSLPLTPPIPIVLKRVACDLARYYLWDTQSTPAIVQRYQDAILLLQSLGSGKTRLEMPATSEPTAVMVKFSQEERNVWHSQRSRRSYEPPSFW